MRATCVAIVLVSAMIGLVMSASGIDSAQARLQGTLRESTELWMAGDTKAKRGAVVRLREFGQKSIDFLIERRAELIKKLQAAKGADRKNITAKLFQLERLIDEVGQQRYASRSGLFWHTDLESAKRMSTETGKPILSLRLLGKLTDEYSCANSRFFRTTLYSNPGIAKFMRENFVLHWKTVRPVPIVTIDFGDGRTIKRTLTGNSIHYVLDAQGKPLDGLPGLYSPKAYQSWLARMKDFHQHYVRLRIKQHEAIKSYHSERYNAVVKAWVDDMKQIGVNLDKETPKRLEAAVDMATWQKIAALHADDARLDRASVVLIASENPTAASAMRLARTKAIVESPLLRMVRNLQNSIAIDTVQNEYLRHRELHRWFAEGKASPDSDKLNDRVYAQLFLTPRRDPWLGLIPPDTYSALKDDGVVKKQ